MFALTFVQTFAAELSAWKFALTFVQKLATELSALGGYGMKIRDVSLRWRLLFGNFLMAVIPALLLTAMGWIIFRGVQFVDTGQRSGLLSAIFPDRGAELSIQFAASSVKIAVEKEHHFRLKKILPACKIFEAQGMSVLILQAERILYVTPNADVQGILRKISARGIGAVS